MMKLVFVTVSAPALKYLPQAVRRVNQMSPQAMALRVYYAVNEFSKETRDKLLEDIEAADATFLDLMGAPPVNVEAVNRGCAMTRGHVIPYGASPRESMRLGAFTARTMGMDPAEGTRDRQDRPTPSPEAMEKMQTMAKAVGKVLPGKMRDMRNYALLCSYFQNATQENYDQMLLLLGAEYGKIRGLPKAKPPVEPAPCAVYDPETGTPYEDMAAFQKAMGYGNEKPNVALHFTAYAYPTDTFPCVRAIAEQLSSFCNVYPIGTSGFHHQFKKDLRRFLLTPQVPVSLYLDCTPFRISAGPMGGSADEGVEMLKQVDAPYLHPMFLTRRTQEDWARSAAGCSANEVLISMMLPEMDGATEIIPVAAMEERSAAQEEPKGYELRMIPERLDHVAQRVRRHLHLRQLDNSQKRVAILCYNYPPGEANLFGGAFLDTFASVAAILARLKQEGYETNALTARDLREIFTMGKAVNSGLYDTNWDGMIRWNRRQYRDDPEICAAWGSAPGEIMTQGSDFLIPGTIQGNIFIGLQPARSGRADTAAVYHDKTLPPHHQYAAFYQWLQEEFRADVIVHVGTHGTLEFLKGKEYGMSGSCWPDRLIGQLPHLYLYDCGNPAEAMIAKRRSHANLISYQPPVFVPGGLYGDWLELSTRLDTYHHLEAVSPGSAEDAKQLVLEQAALLSLPQDLEEIESELYRMSRSLIPKGLHIFGESYTEEELDQYAMGIATLRCGGKDPDDNTLAQARKDAAPAGHCHEMEGLLAALDERYHPPRLAGDIFRSPEILPSGYNLYQFDSRLVPSEAAVRRGSRIAGQTLRAYYEEHHCYPQSVAVIAWGLETSRTQGESIGEILAYLGVRPARGSSLWDHKYELIPLRELGRPRVDVTVNICGFFRDMFYPLIEQLDDVLHMLFAAPESEEQNYFRAHARRRYQRLMEEGYSPEEAEELAVARIFGPKEGEYGTGLTELLQQKAWQQEQELGANYTDSLHYLYSRHSSGRKAKRLYQENLGCVDLISQLRASTEYEITDLDHYYEFFGGLAKSVEMVRGKKSAMYITDVTGGQVHTETVDRSIARGLRTRVLNPKWIDGMLAHPYHGGEQIARRFENVQGLAATTGAVAPHFYDDLEACYVKDEARKRQMAENNPHAYLKILEQMLEYHSRGYWDASQEQLDRIQSAYLDLEQQLETMQPQGQIQ